MVVRAQDPLLLCAFRVSAARSSPSYPKTRIHAHSMNITPRYPAAAYAARYASMNTPAVIESFLIGRLLDGSHAGRIAPGAAAAIVGISAPV